MSQSHYTTRINEIAGLSQLWKVQWLGELSINQTTYEPLIDLWMVPLKTPDSYNPEDKALASNENYDFSKMKVVKVGVGELPLISAGSIFKNGYLLERPSYLTYTFEFESMGKNSITLHNYTPKFSPAPPSLDFPGKGNLLKLNFNKDEAVFNADIKYPRGFKHLKTKIKSGRKKFEGLKIPCTEMVRFYYANSSQMFQKVFTDGLLVDDNSVFKKSKRRMPDERGRNGFLYLSKGVKNIDAPIIARLAFDSHALEQARRIYLSTLKGDGGRVPVVDFPFVNQGTRLKVHGTFLEDKYTISFLVFWIESCTAKFPFQDFTYWRENPGTMSYKRVDKDFEGNPAAEYPENYSPINAKIFRNKYRSVELSFQSEVSSSKTRGDLELFLPLNKFPDLQGKEWKSENPNPALDPPVKEDTEKGFFDISEPVESVSTAPRDGTKKVTKVSVGTDFQNLEGISSLTEDLPQREQLTSLTSILFDEIVEIINNDKKSGLTAQRIYLSTESDEISFGDKPSRFPEIDFDLIEDKRKNHIKKLSNQDVYLMQITHNRNQDSYFYLFDIVPFGYSEDKRRGFCLCLAYKEKSFESLTGVVVKEILENCLLLGGIWIKNHTSPKKDEANVFDRIKTVQKDENFRSREGIHWGVREIKIQHSFSKTHGYVKTILRKINQSLVKAKLIEKS